MILSIGSWPSSSGFIRIIAGCAGLEKLLALENYLRQSTEFEDYQQISWFSGGAVAIDPQ